MTDKSNNKLMYLMIIIATVWMTSMAMRKPSIPEMTYDSFQNHVIDGKIAKIEIPQEGSGNSIATLKDGSKVSVALSKNENIKDLSNQKISVKVLPTKTSMLDILFSWLPTLLLIGVFVYFHRKNAQSLTSPLKENHKGAVLNEKSKVSLDEVKGCDNAKREVAEIIEYMKTPERYIALGAQMPRGALMYGPPGTGKTMLARAMATESGAEFISRSGSSFVQMFVGVGSSRIRELFDEARSFQKPVIIFIDEIDSIGKSRSMSNMGNDERENTLNQLLVEMDGLSQNENIFVIGATNRLDLIDEALRRPGRFDRLVQIDLPDVTGRQDILMNYVKTIPLANDVNIANLAKSTPGFSGAELKNVCNEASIFAARNNSNLVTQNHFDMAVDKVLMGVEKNMVMSEKEKSDTAYHEVGHAIVGHIAVGDPIQKVSIVPRGKALGVTVQVPEKERYSYSKRFAEDYIAMLLAGRAAEELFTGDVTSGASSDIERATRMAKAMVKEWGMSEKVGLLHVDKDGLNPEHQAIVDGEISAIIDRAYNRAKKMLLANEDLVHRFTKVLLEKETINKDEIDGLFAEYELVHVA